MVVERGQVWLINFDPAFDVERGGSRPALIVSNDVGNRYGPLAIVVPMTSRVEKKRLPTHVWVDQAVSGLKGDSLILAEQVRSVSKRRFERLLTTLPTEVMSEVNQALKIAMSLD